MKTEITDYEALINAFEMAEVLDDYDSESIFVEVFDEFGNNKSRVVFEFNEDKELIRVYKEN